ncbi:unnamed protein product [Paramecium sonneborni]|uniref:Actin-related protein 6 n=1 Tax=Paramecium sonneborni TaxID=65129 RepID=A0A8S1QBJ2_9CILI|nr:unnamed protein product [Paramecium sonneborni]
MDNWRQNNQRRFVLDNGSYQIRYGNDVQKHKQLNLIAHLKKTGQMIYDFDTLFDESQVMTYYKPHVRGVLVDFDKQINIWDKFLNPKLLKDCSITYPFQPFTPDQVVNKLFDVMFEYYNVDAFCPINAQKMLYYNVLAREGLQRKQFTYIIDTSHSATYLVPIFDGEIMYSGLRRIDIGGRLLTNQLKENISFKQFDLKNYFLLSSKIKELLCFVSMNYFQDMKKPKNFFRKYYILPDFEIRREGYAVDLLNVGFLDEKLILDKERITIPEILFHPTEIGLAQKGPTETFFDSLSTMHKDLQGYFAENVYLSGGNSFFSSFYERLSNEIRQNSSQDWNVNVTHLDDIDSVFQGTLNFNRSNEFQNACFTKAEYLEKGFDNIKQYII